MCADGRQGAVMNSVSHCSRATWILSQLFQHTPPSPPLSYQACCWLAVQTPPTHTHIHTHFLVLVCQQNVFFSVAEGLRVASAVVELCVSLGTASSLLTRPLWLRLGRSHAYFCPFSNWRASPSTDLSPTVDATPVSPNAHWFIVVVAVEKSVSVHSADK